MTELVQIGSTNSNLLVPQTTLPDLLCHTITDGELEMLTNRTATIMGGICTASFGMAIPAVIEAWPAIEAVKAGTPASADSSAYVYLIILVVMATTFVISGILSASHERNKADKAEKIRKRPKMPMRMQDAG